MVNDQEKKRTNTKLLVAIAVAAVLVAGGGFVVLSGAGGLLSSTQQATELSATQGVVKIPLSNITNTYSLYTYESNGTAIKFFAVKGTDGDVHVAFATAMSAVRRGTSNLATIWCVTTVASTLTSTQSERLI